MKGIQMKPQRTKRRSIKRRPPKSFRHLNKHKQHRLKQQLQRSQRRSRKVFDMQENRWLASAYQAGEMGAKAGDTGDLSRLQERWLDFLHQISRSGQPIPWKRYGEMLERFKTGAGLSLEEGEAGMMWLPTRKTAAVVMTVMNEELAIERAIAQVRRLPFHEVIVVVNGSSDLTFEKVPRFDHVMIEHYSDPLGHDVGRALGTRLSTADIVLYLDGDFTVPAEDMLPFLYAVECGADIALNDISSYIGVFSQQDQVTRLKSFLNRTMGRGDLKFCSMTAVPHALSREAVSQVGIAALAVPPLAQVRAMLGGLKVQAAASVDVVGTNRIRSHNVGEANPVANMILGDYAEAFAEWIRSSGNRAHYPDELRRRSAVFGGERL